MKLKTKVSIIIVIIWAAAAMLFYYGTQTVILGSYLKLEDRSILENVNRTESNLNQIIDSLATSSEDWAIWDETYEFMQDKNEKYVKSSLAISSFQSIDIDVMLFFNNDGSLMRAYTVNQDRTEFIETPKELLAILTPQSKLVDLHHEDSSERGLLSIPTGILLVASHTITTSEKKGPVRGVIVLGRYLTNTTLANIENLARADATIYRYPNILKDNKIREIADELKYKRDNVISKTEDKISGYRFIFDINKNPIAILRVETPRSVYQLGLETIRYSDLMLFLYSILLTVLLWLLLQYLIVKRIEKLTSNISFMGRGKKILSHIVENVADEVSSVATLYHQATHDPLTGLANRNLLNQSFKHATETFAKSNNKIVIIFIDLDHFKTINDMVGHDVGDQLLVTTGKRLSETLRDHDLAARLGGDEFVVMLADIDEDQVDSVTNRIFKNINKPLKYDNHEIYVSCSMGVCIYPDDGDTIEQLIKHADMALYHAKENGRNHYQFYSQSLKNKINEAHQHEIELQYALDDNQLCMFYQPIYNLQNKKITSLEALIRWHHPSRGLLGAKDIIPIAERTNLIYPIGDWIINTICKQQTAWLKEGVKVVPIAINVSSLQLKQPAFCEKFIKMITDASIDPSLIQIEITETGFFDITPNLLQGLDMLRKAGIKLSIDDFGTGYAGLGYLKRLPVSKIKIDQSFTKEVHIDSGDRAITLAVIAIAHELNLLVVAEGIENIDQYNFMSHHQVDEVQGHFLSEPLDADDCAKILTSDITSKHTTL